MNIERAAGSEKDAHKQMTIRHLVAQGLPADPPPSCATCPRYSGARCMFGSVSDVTVGREMVDPSPLKR